MSTSSFDDWETYPLNLGNKSNISCFYNLATYDQRIRDDSARIFVEHEMDVSIKVVEFLQEGWIFLSGS